ncbi:dTDP-glucose 4,6-dehydratase [Winogradskyella wandonensis]|uniref:dTDP-glucose 4,6-dehydratase n=1 Tax=Winogradskyella wandonensis TaxID=1442586 RepID=A0A4R1KTE2_9FLAO|nr:dTDP-glucose 4,6-dehydratase [Winogradskyella wandonensis]TCK67817.1 dTDP-glucose 4,6-dehydratase [Winogradskyella wandonensis]
MKFLITGGLGFIGSNFIEYYLKKYSGYQIVNLDKLTYAGELSNLKSVVNHPNYTYIKGDICDKNLIKSLFEEYNFSHVIHFAAESHVDNSIASPDAFINTNVVGTFNLLDIAKNHWMQGPFKFKNGCEKNRFHHISTDEVYGTLEETGLFTETTAYAPNSPYSASKASSDFLVRSYFHTYGMNVVTTNCSNNYGPKQHDEKLIPTIIRKALKGEQIPIYGDGKNIRDWLYVLDHCKGIDLAFQKGKSGETYNIGGKNERDNLYIANTICSILDNLRPREDSYSSLITFVSDRPGHDFRYAIDASKIENELGWSADEDFESGIIKTVNWYINKYEQ